MNKEKSSNSGFTLVELIIAMAILAFLMTAVSSLMGTSVSSYKKTKADTELQATAQETYNQISDSIMQATSIVVAGYPVSDLDFSEDGADVTLATPNLTYYMLGTDEELDKYSGKNIVKFKDMDSSTQIAVTQIIVENSVPLDIKAAGKSDSLSEWSLTNALTGKNVKVTKLADGVLDTNDTVRLTYTFSGKNMYIEREYAFMTTKNDKSAEATTTETVAELKARMKGNLYSESLSYLNVAGADGLTLSGCVVTINPDTASVGLTISYNAKNATVTSKGYVSARNTYVFTKKSAVAAVGATTETSEDSDGDTE